MSAPVDLLIVGAGPAGMAAALEAKAAGISALVLDENAAPGGQVWRGAEANGTGAPWLGPDYAAGAEMAAAFRRSGVPGRFGATVWAVEADGSVFFSSAGAAESVRPGRILLATGAMERPMPIPGWTLPGVMTVGAAQILLKTSGLRPQGRVVLAGQGPLLRLFAQQALAAGGELGAILDISPSPASVLGAGELLRLRRAMPQVLKGFSWGRAIKGAGVAWRRVEGIAAEAGPDGRLARVRFHEKGAGRVEAADLLLLHDGLVPSTQLSRALGLTHSFDRAQHAWRPVTDAWGRSSDPRVLVAGDGAGILGAEAAVLGGRLAAIAAAQDLGRLAPGPARERALPLQARLSAQQEFRAVLDKLYPARMVRLDDATIVCRCEEVSAGEVRAAARLGCLGLNQMKAFTRCGMGPCQGRMCGPVAADVLAEARGVGPEAIEPYRARFPTKPLTLGELATLAG